MDEMWKVHGRVKPVPLDVEAINNGSFTTPPLRNPPAPAAAAATSSNGEASGSDAGPSKAPAAPSVSHATLRDQRELSVKDNLELFIDR
jgi:ubiquitin-like 1-activating enzyme E1 B